ncbi:MAG: tyrosine-type recombinase/integrase [Thermoleophilaceae bacterium]|nr:tyrosine-type recombinase/integrase [Thermoleophilaceae bacterium]
MPLALASSDPPRAPAPRALIDAYLVYLARTGRKSDTRYERAAERFFARWPDPMAWAAEPLEQRRATNPRTRTLVMFLMLHRHLRPGYDYLLDITLLALWRELPASPLQGDLEQFRVASRELGFTSQVSKGAAGLVAARLLIQTGRGLADLTDDDIAAFDAALRERQARTGRGTGHYGRALFSTRSVLYHLGILVRPPTHRARTPAQSYEQRLAGWGVSDQLRATFVAYLERLHATHADSTVSGRATQLAHFGRHLAEVDPGLPSVADLDRQRHIETYLTATANATRQVDGAPISIEERRGRIIAVHCFLNDIGQWGWKQAPDRRLIFPRDTPRRPQPLPRYLPADADRRLSDALSSSHETLAANALLLCRATGLRIGELVDLELDCVHEVPGQGAWLKVPLGKLATERMVPLDDQALAIVDRIVAARSPGRPLPHPRDGRLVDFLLTHHGRRMTDYALRGTLQRAAEAAGLAPVTPHQLRHTYATALINAGVSLQALMALLGHSSAAMSLRYGRLFDATVRADYERALTLAKERLGPVLPDTPTKAPDGDWRELPLIKSRMAGGYCLRTAAQGVCAYTNICEHCPNYRSEPAMLAVLSAQRVDAQALAEDARKRGWDDEATRHTALAERLDALIATTNAA